MNARSSLFLFLLRIAMGWLFFYAGITKVLNASWSAAGYLKGAQTFAPFYQFLLKPEILPWINGINKWGLVLLGISLLAGLYVRWTSIAGAVLMLLYYLPILHFPYVGDHSYIVDEHVIYIICLLLLSAANAGRHWGIDRVRKGGYSLE